jgi:CheY-like chemotaxis protein
MKEKKKANVLLVDSDKISLMYYSAILKNYSAKVSANIYEAENGEKAKGIIAKLEERQDHFDLAIIYQKLDDMPGREICQLVREKNKAAKIIAATINPCNYRAKNAEEEGFDGYLLKPITVQRFLEVIQN